MYRVEVPSTINRITALFYRLRVWDRNEENFIWSTLLKSLQAINFVSFFVSITISVATSPKIQDAVFLTDFTILTGTHTIRLVYILWKKTEILQFIDEIGKQVTDDINESNRIKNKISFILKFAKAFVFACIGEVILIMVCPILSRSNESIINLAFPLKKSGLAFWISHLFVSLGCVYCVIWFLVTVIIWYLMLCCSFKNQLLGNQLRSLGNRDIKEKTPKKQQHQLFMEDLIKAIKAHRKIHGIIEHFSSTFSTFFFIQIMTSSISICAGVYNLAFSQHENLLADIFNYFFSIYFFLDIFVLMFFGNEIKLSSDRLSYCLFESNWIEQSPTCKKYIIIFTEILKRPQELLIGKLYPLNLKTFMSIVNGAYSMFNILRG